MTKKTHKKETSTKILVGPYLTYILIGVICLAIGSIGTYIYFSGNENIESNASEVDSINVDNISDYTSVSNEMIDEYKEENITEVTLDLFKSPQKTAKNKYTLPMTGMPSCMTDSMFLGELNLYEVENKENIIFELQREDINNGEACNVDITQWILKQAASITGGDEGPHSLVLLWNTNIFMSMPDKNGYGNFIRVIMHEDKFTMELIKSFDLYMSDLKVINTAQAPIVTFSVDMPVFGCEEEDCSWFVKEVDRMCGLKQEGVYMYELPYDADPRLKKIVPGTAYCN